MLQTNCQKDRRSRSRNETVKTVKKIIMSGKLSETFIQPQYQVTCSRLSVDFAHSCSKLFTDARSLTSYINYIELGLCYRIDRSFCYCHNVLTLTPCCLWECSHNTRTNKTHHSFYNQPANRKRRRTMIDRWTRRSSTWSCQPNFVYGIMRIIKTAHKSFIHTIRMFTTIANHSQRRTSVLTWLNYTE